jgi:periplasmic protein TonB
MSDQQDKKSIIRTLDDLVFESRNKEYGCYHLRKTQRRRLLISFLWAMGSFLGAVTIIYFVEINPWNNRFDQSDLSQMDSISYDHDMVTILSQLSEILPEPVTPPVIALEATPQEDLLQEMAVRKTVPVIEIKPLLPREDTSDKRLVSELLRKHETQQNRANQASADSLTMILENVPQFPGGYAAVQSYFYKNQHYPESALIHGIHGSTMVSFIISSTGIVQKPAVVKGVDPELDREAIRLVKSMPPWQPALYKGKPIASMLVMPVNFTIR